MEEPCCSGHLYAGSFAAGGKERRATKTIGSRGKVTLSGTRPHSRSRTATSALPRESRLPVRPRQGGTPDNRGHRHRTPAFASAARKREKKMVNLRHKVPNVKLCVRYINTYATLHAQYAYTLALSGVSRRFKSHG